MGGGGGLGPHIKFGGKIWGKVQPSYYKRKNLGSSVTTRRKSWENIPILGSYLKLRGQNLGYLSPIFLEAKFGAPNKNFEGKFWGQAPPDILIWKYAPGHKSSANYQPSGGRYLQIISGKDLYNQIIIVIGDDTFYTRFPNIFVHYTLGSLRLR